MTATPPLAGGRLRLEPLRVDHAAEMESVLADAGLYTFTGGAPPSRGALELRYARQVAGSPDPGEEWHTWVARLGDDGPAVGYVQATVRPGDGVAELAWVVGAAWQGQGLAREAAALVLTDLEARGLSRVVAHIRPDHLSSQRVAAALGMAPTDRLVDGEVEWQLVVRPRGLAHDRGGPRGATPVVLVHAGVADRRMWDAQWGALTGIRDAVRLDLRGFGESTARPARLDHVADVVATLDDLGIASCHLVGCSLGAGVAVEVALTEPARVRSLLLASPGGSLITQRTPALAAFAAAEDDALARGDLDAAVEANLATWVLGRGRGRGDVDPDVVAAVRVMQRRAFEVTRDWDDVDEVEIDPPAVDRLEDLRQPVLLVVGGRDLDTVHLAADRAQAGAPRVRRADLPGTAHLPSMEEPEAFLGLLLDWVAEQDG